MITMQQMVDAIAHADEWPDELMRLRQENAELRSQLEVVTARAQRKQARADFYFQMTVDAAKIKER